MKRADILRLTPWLAVAMIIAGCRRPAPPPPSPAAMPAPRTLPPFLSQMQPGGARVCALCHLSWVETFQPGRARGPLLIERPPDGIVSESDTCLGCHDGAVGDSRRRVWLAHGHQTGVTPPAAMKVPDALPLEDNRLACRTCHTAHVGGGPEDLATTVFVRTPNESSQLCRMCHPEKTKGPELGTHPIGGMPWPVPDALLAAGAKVTNDRQRLICQTCHTPHGAPGERLLVMGTQSSQLCLTCHARLRPGMWRPDMAREHPQNPPLSSDTQRRAIQDMKTVTGPGDTLICLSCHKLHHGLAGRDMLADTLHDSQLCIRCHPERGSMFGSRHDLRKSAPAERDRRGRTPEQSGPCGACHSFHDFARTMSPAMLDPGGVCATCHRADRCAAKATGEPLSHPADITSTDVPSDARLPLYPAEGGGTRRGLACLTCHDPHQVAQPHFLRDQPDQICAACHAAGVPAVTGEHDFTRHPERTNARGRSAAETGRCGFCHGVHNANGPMLWVATKATPQAGEGLCRECHRPDGMAADKPARAVVHPTTRAVASSVKAPETTLPLFGADGRRAPNGSIACATCHDVHRGAPGCTAMLRRGAAGNATGCASLCTECHPDTRFLATSSHNPRLLRAYAGADRVCGPCHAVHADPETVARGSWVAPQGPDDDPPDIRRCTGCHGLSGTAAARITPVHHPVSPLQNVVPPGSPGFMPLVNDDGVAGAEGHITCATCHAPHGQGSDTGSSPVDMAGIEDPEHLRMVKSMLRSYTAPNLCSSCHGFDGLRRYLYYHAPEKRTFSTEQPTTAPSSGEPDGARPRT